MEQELSDRRNFLISTATAWGAALGVAKPLRAGTNTDYAKVVLARRPVAYWRLGEAAGPQALDSSGNGHQGVYRGTPTLGERGAIEGDTNTAIRLVGSRSYVEILDHRDFSQPTSGKGLTVEAWIRPDVLEF